MSTLSTFASYSAGLLAGVMVLAALIVLVAFFAIIWAIDRMRKAPPWKAKK